MSVGTAAWEWRGSANTSDDPPYKTDEMSTQTVIAAQADIAPAENEGGRERPLLAIIAFWVRLIIVVLPVLICTGWLGGVWSMFDLASHFQFQYAIAAIVCASIASLLHMWRWAILAILCLAITAPRVIPWYVPPASEIDAAGRATIRVLHANVLRANRRHDDLLALIELSDPDVVVLQEMNDRWMRELSSIRQRLPHVISDPREDNFGLAVFSRYPLENTEIATFGSAGVRSIVCEIEVDDRRLTIVTTHLLQPVTGRRSRLRDEQLAVAARRVKGIQGPVILVGDLNATMWSRPYLALVRETGLVNARAGRGTKPTWPTSLPEFMRIPIDHCLHSPETDVISFQIGEDIGSDHLPLIVDLALEQ